MSVFPNPTRDGTTIALAPGQTADLRVDVHDVAGRLVRSIDGSSAAAGAIRWDTRDASGRAVLPGVYFLTVRAAGSRDAHRVTVIR